MNRWGGASSPARWRAVVFVAVVKAGALHAAEPAQKTTEELFLADIPVVLTASRLGQPPSDAPNAITVIDRELIQASGAREISDLLRFVPGMYVTNVTYREGLQPIVSYHGLASEVTNRMQVLVDGRAVYNPTLGEVGWDDLPLVISDIDRIEVVRGPSAATHGANSFLGVINIITRHPAEERGAYGSLMEGNHSIDEGVMRYGASVGDLDYRLTASYRADDTYPAIPDSRRLHLFTLRADYRLGNRDSLTFQAGYNGGHRDMGGPSGGSPDPTDPVRTIMTRNDFEQLRWRRRLDGGDELSLQLYHNHLGIGDSFETDPIAVLGNQQFPLDNSIRADRYDAELQHRVNVSRRLRWVWGGSVRYDHSDAPIYLAAPVGNHSSNVFGHAEWRPSRRWVVNAGAMVERTDFTGTDVSPRLGINYRLAPQHTLRASISRALRNPSLFEEKADLRFQLGPVLVQRFLSSGNLQPERILSREVGYIGEFPRLGLSFDAKVFDDHLTGLIGSVTVPFPAGFQGITREFRNEDEVTQRGFETQLRWRLADGTRLGLAQSYIDTRSANIGGPYSSSTPRDIYSAFAVKRLGEQTTGTLMAFHQSAVEALGFSQPQVAFNRVDARIARRFALGRAKAQMALVVQNLFNYKYTDFRHDDVFDRRAYVTLEADF